MFSILVILQLSAVITYLECRYYRAGLEKEWTEMPSASSRTRQKYKRRGGGERQRPRETEKGGKSSGIRNVAAEWRHGRRRRCKEVRTAQGCRLWAVGYILASASTKALRFQVIGPRHHHDESQPYERVQRWDCRSSSTFLSVLYRPGARLRPGDIPVPSGRL